MTDKPTPSLQHPAPLKNERSEDFSEAYANNAAFEASPWDLKITFGQLDQAMGVIHQHTAMSLPWAIVKLSLYHLKLQVAAYETLYGKIMIPPEALPPEPTVPPEQLKDNQKAQQVYEAFKKLHDEFIKENK